MSIEYLSWAASEIVRSMDFPINFIMSFIKYDFKSYKVLFSFVASFSFVCVVISLIFWLSEVTDWKHSTQTEETKVEKELQITPYIHKPPEPVEMPRINHNFLPDASDLEVEDDFGDMKFLSELARKRSIIDPANEPEALIAVQMALRMKQQQKYEKAQKLFQHAMALHQLHPDILNHYGEFIEESHKDFIQADQLYTKALIVCPDHSKALVNRRRTLPVVDKLDEKQLKRIDKKRNRLIEIPHNDLSLKRMKKEAYFQHIHHTVAIEGNTMTLAETRTVIETRTAISGKSIVEHNEIIGLDNALRYINNTLVNKNGFITVQDILQMHKRVIGNVDPIEAGSLRRTQVFVGEHTPPAPRYLQDLMEELLDWLSSDGVLKLHPVKQAALAHYKLVHIHPFIDGNGRTARLLMNLILMRAGYPPVIIRKQDRTLYYKHLRMADEGDVRPFIRFIAQSTEGTLDVYLYATKHGIDSVKALEGSDHEKLCDISSGDEDSYIAVRN